MPSVIPYIRVIRFLQIPPSRVAATKIALADVYAFDLLNGTAYSDRIVELLERLEFLAAPPSYQPVGTPGLLGLPEHGVKSFSDGDFSIEYKEEKGVTGKGMAIASAKSELWGILADFGYVQYGQGVLERS